MEGGKVATWKPEAEASDLPGGPIQAEPYLKAPVQDHPSPPHRVEN